MIYLDTSALLPYYRAEALSEVIQDLLMAAEEQVLITDLTKVEFASALARWVKMKELSEADALGVEAAFFEDIDAGCYSVRAIESRHYEKAMDWLLSRKAPLRTLDALHLAVAALRRADLVTADTQLAQAAQIFGVRYQLLVPRDQKD
jgi:predicted nucleic acid-binding protein